MTEDRSFGKKSPKSKLNCRFGRFYVFFFSSWAPSQQALCRAGFSLSSVSIIGQLAGKGRGGGVEVVVRKSLAKSSAMVF